MAEEADGKKAITLTEGETKLFISIMKNLESDIQFNAQAVATECGYKSVKVVKDRWSQIKKNKLGLVPGATPKATPKAAAKKRKGEEVGEEDEEVSATPSKKGKKGKAKAKQGEDHDDGEEVKGEEAKMEGVVKEEPGDDFGDDGEE